jgi:phospholipid transport system substrate-binding protein
MMLMRRRVVVQALLALCVAGAARPAAAATADDARKFIQGVADTAITTVADKSLSNEARNDRFRQLFVSTFDLPAISRLVLARYWRSATPQQQQTFLKLFEEVQVLMWARRFRDYNGQRLQTQDATGEGSDWVVDTVVIRPQQQPLPVQWRIHDTGGGKFAILDVMPEGVSMAMTHRDEYAAVLKANGGNIDALLESLRAKIAQLRASQ